MFLLQKVKLLNLIWSNFPVATSYRLKSPTAAMGDSLLEKRREKSGFAKPMEPKASCSSTSQKKFTKLLVKGFLGFTFHPDYFNNGYFYAYYLNKKKNTVISRFSVNPNNPNEALVTSEKIILTIKQVYGGNHYGGCIGLRP